MIEHDGKEENEKIWREGKNVLDVFMIIYQNQRQGW